MTRVDKHALTAALAERDAARAEVARLRAAVEGMLADGNVIRAVGGPRFVSVDDIRKALAATEDQP